MLTARLADDFLCAFISVVDIRSSVEVAATQKEPTGFADHLAAGVAHFRAAVRAIAGNIRLSFSRELLSGRSRTDVVIVCHRFILQCNPFLWDRAEKTGAATALALATSQASRAFSSR
ncbi:MAG TPA: hypothetical protein VKL99_17270 [Candidatus Angelobacter sp.]|nr:hypothetical protein [Candidatus Angelobacter sp.]